MNATPTNRSPRRSASRPGFTLIELLVTVALLAAVIVVVSQVFRISTDAAGRTTAQTEVFAAAAAFREHVTDLIAKMENNFLMIDSPPPTAVRREVPGGDMIYRQRNDRLVFVASGGNGEFESVTDPTRGTPYDRPAGDTNQNNLYAASLPARSSEALIYIGPGNPLLNAAQVLTTDNEFLYSNAATMPIFDVPASDWVLSARTILLGVESQTSTPGFLANPTTYLGVAAPAPTISDMVSGATPPVVGPLPFVFRMGRLDFLLSDSTGSANAATLIDRLNRIGRTAQNPTPLTFAFAPNLDPLVAMNYTPNRAEVVDPTKPSFYTRSGFNFLPHVADLRIEWTDGRPIERQGTPPDLRTRWLGLKTADVLYPNPSGVRYRAHMRSVPNQATHSRIGPDSPLVETQAFRRIEWSPYGAAVNPDAHYRAIWRADTWEYRPKALKFTFRIYDRNNRLKTTGPIDLNDNGKADHLENPGTPSVSTRYGQEFSFVISMP